MAKKNMRHEELPTKGAGYNVGDILTGRTHMYRTVTRWYQIVKITPKRLVMKRLPVAYTTPYRSNTPGDSCMPVVNVKGTWFIPEGFPYTDPLEYGETVTARLVELPLGDGVCEYVDVLGDSSAPLLSMWNGEEGWVNCD